MCYVFALVKKYLRCDAFRRYCLSILRNDKTEENSSYNNHETSQHVLFHKNSTFDSLEKSGNDSPSSMKTYHRSKSFELNNSCRVVRVCSLNSVIIRHHYDNRLYILEGIIVPMYISEPLYQYILYQMKQLIQNKTFIVKFTEYNTIHLYKDRHYVNNMINNIIINSQAIHL